MKALEFLSLAQRTLNVLTESNITTVEQLQRMTYVDVLMLPNMDKKSADEIMARLHDHSLRLASIGGLHHARGYVLVISQGHGVSLWGLYKSEVEANNALTAHAVMTGEQLQGRVREATPEENRHMPWADAVYSPVEPGFVAAQLDGGPAYPGHTNPRPGHLANAAPGMSLRDYFATHASDRDIDNMLPSADGKFDQLCANIGLKGGREERRITARAWARYQHADAMLAARGIKP